ncbi:MAG: 50S ribosomal protein L15 [Victivallaceae bacterium]
MKLHELKNTPGATSSRKRVGRGDSSGWGRTCGRGEKGQKSRTGSSIRPFFEGGQIPLFRRLPKRGFKSFDRKEYNVINLGVLEANFEQGTVIDLEVLKAQGFVGKSNLELKVLANGDISKAFTVKAHKFSDAAKAKIEAAGGKCETL